MQRTLTRTTKNGAGRQPFAPIHNLPVFASSEKIQKIISYIPIFGKRNRESEEKMGPGEFFPKSTDVHHPHRFEPTEANKSNDCEQDTSRSSIYSQVDVDLSQAPCWGRNDYIRIDLCDEASAVASTVITTQLPSGPLKRVRTVYKSAGFAMLERRRKGQDFDMSAGSLRHIAVLLRQRREAAERYFKF
ncbi:hypothetical protein AX17_004230 [Amanita inopinata Kibby_2008]|nr:hypothetical protein AX17_004230 [Amanita inopinata Kibby_2008]